MNWYRKAKLVDLDPPKQMTLHCMYCNRWATTELNDATKQDAVWKKEKDLSPEEKNEVDNTREGKMYSSGICPTCYKIVKNYMSNDITSFTPNMVKSLSMLLPP